MQNILEYESSCCFMKNKQTKNQWLGMSFAPYHPCDHGQFTPLPPVTDQLSRNNTRASLQGRCQGHKWSIGKVKQVAHVEAAPALSVLSSHAAPTGQGTNTNLGDIQGYG